MGRSALNFWTSQRAGRVFDLEVEKEDDDDDDDIDDVTCVGKEVRTLELGAFRARSFAAVPF